MTILEVIIVILVLVILAWVFLPALVDAKKRHESKWADCVNNLKQIGLANRLWAQDNRDLLPLQVSVTNGGAMELVVTGNVVAFFQTLSNELNTPRILLCAGDSQHQFVTNFSRVTAANISYFVGLDAAPKGLGNRFLSGDDNFTLRGLAVNSGLFNLASNAPADWTRDRHRFGNTLFDDGRVDRLTSEDLANRLVETGLATNHFAIP